MIGVSETKDPLSTGDFHKNNECREKQRERLGPFAPFSLFALSLPFIRLLVSQLDFLCKNPLKQLLRSASDGCLLPASLEVLVVILVVPKVPLAPVAVLVNKMTCVS